MSNEDALSLLRQVCDEMGQAAVARLLVKPNGKPYSGSSVCSILQGKYNGDPTHLLNTVVEVFGGGTLPCPFLKEEIALKVCAEHRRRPFQEANNSYLVRIYRACRTCPNGGGKP